MQNRIFNFLIVLAAFMMVGPVLHADSVEEASARIKDRLAQVDSLKAEGLVGEDARGYLVARSAIGPRQSALVEAENADRRLLYQAVAQRTNQTLDQVGEQRAIQIASRARSGVWLQKPSGEWFQKP